MNNRRRQWLNRFAASAGLLTARASLAQTSEPKKVLPAKVLTAPDLSTQNLPAQVLPTTLLQFPRDFGSHPNYRTEWWYISGWLDVGSSASVASGSPSAGSMGFQITFFRTRTGLRTDNPSLFTPRQILFAHIALSQGGSRTLLHDQLSARAGFGLAQSSEADTDVVIKNWQLIRSANDVYSARCATLSGGPKQQFGLNITLTPPGPPQLQGDAGFSRKGPNVAQASHYYSRPQMVVQGDLTLKGSTQTITGRAWLDHEWSSTLLDPQAVGWDWVGINLTNGGSLLAFRLRKNDGANVWTHVALRDASGKIQFKNNEANGATFTPKRFWQSIQSGARYPVQQTLQFSDQTFVIDPLFDEQEIDGRLSTGGFYWEGAVFLRDANQAVLGRGYLEMTGYASPIKL